jgi:hypothetical protein
LASVHTALIHYFSTPGARVTHSSTVAYCCTHYLPRICLPGKVFIEPLPSSGSIRHNIFNFIKFRFKSERLRFHSYFFYHLPQTFRKVSFYLDTIYKIALFLRRMWLPSKEFMVHVDRFMLYVYRPALHGLLEVTEWGGGLYIRRYILLFILLI